MRLLAEQDHSQNIPTRKEVFKFFEGICLTNTGPQAEQTWQTAVARYEESLENLQSRVAAYIRQQLNSLSDSPLHLIQELHQNSGLLRLGRIQKDLLPEREILLSKLLKLIKKFSDDFDSHNVTDNKASNL